MSQGNEPVKLRKMKKKIKKVASHDKFIESLNASDPAIQQLDNEFMTPALAQSDNLKRNLQRALFETSNELDEQLD